MKVNTLATGTLGLAGLVTVGLLSLPGVTTWADDQAVKRDEDTPELVLVDDDDDDDTNSRSGTNTGNTNTGTATRSGDQNDPTRSNFTNVSRDGEPSRWDKTRDRTRDGAGASKRDWSGNGTNDRSRNDTRR
ncbi:MAG: hypothetical protein ACRDOM_00240 [Nocardioides sp.]